MPAIEKGTIKVVWITKDTKKIYSRMFEDVNKANRFGESKKNYLVFKLLWHKKFQFFAWELLPHGNYKLYQSALKFYQKYKDEESVVKKIFGL
ncbi:MAG: hypothetical protein HY361_04295 [Candidatus Aenigmarchaeota archaeon]|nr:hypothetical protein [Candidatus Aenigmarchaeota archaeon]